VQVHQKEFSQLSGQGIYHLLSALPLYQVFFGLPFITGMSAFKVRLTVTVVFNPKDISSLVNRSHYFLTSFLLVEILRFKRLIIYR
jgi:hypothetical protein